MPDILKLPESEMSDAVTHIQIAIAPNDSGGLDILKHVALNNKIAPIVARTLCRGEARGIIHRASVWKVKKTYQKLMTMLPGKHLLHASVTPPAAPAPSGEPASSANKGKWQPTKEEIRDGFRFIKENCPGGYEPNDILEFCVSSVHTDTPVTGWPMSIVERACPALSPALRRSARRSHPGAACVHSAV